MLQKQPPANNAVSAAAVRRAGTEPAVLAGDEQAVVAERRSISASRFMQEEYGEGARA
jgi:hypothetical protein